MKKINFADKLILWLVIIGGLNWGLVGLFKYNVIDSLVGRTAITTRVIYVLIGAAAVYLFSQTGNLGRMIEKKEE